MWNDATKSDYFIIFLIIIVMIPLMPFLMIYNWLFPLPIMPRKKESEIIHKEKPPTFPIKRVGNVEKKEAGVMLIIKDGLILGISRRDNKSIFGLLGGKKDATDSNTMETAIRETKEECGITVNKCVWIYERMERAIEVGGFDFFSRCYYATDWSGDPQTYEEGIVEWLTYDELVSSKAAFPEYNKATLDVFKWIYPDVYIYRGSKL